MALAAGDLFVVQKDPGGALAKVTAQELNDYLEASDSVTYKGAKDFGASLDDPANSGPINTGDLYINTGDTAGPWAWADGPAPTPNPTPLVTVNDVSTMSHFTLTPPLFYLYTFILSLSSTLRVTIPLP